MPSGTSLSFTVYLTPGKLGLFLKVSKPPRGVIDFQLWIKQQADPLLIEHKETQ